jgi:DNA-binding CsgD family transcriptional regulator
MNRNKAVFIPEKHIMATQNHALKMHLHAFSERFMQHFDIGDIGYSFVYTNGRRVIIETCQAFIEDYCCLDKKEELEDLEFYCSVFSQTSHTKIYSRIWQEPPKTSVFNLLEKYSIAKCIGFYRRCPQGLEAIHFANYADNHQFYNTYLNNIELFQQFVCCLSSYVQSFIEAPTTQTFSMLPIVAQSPYPLIPAFQDHLHTQPVKEVSAEICQRLLHLSKREYECLRLLATGYTSKEIAWELGLSPRTVETYFVHLRDKTFTHNKFALARLALQHRHLFNI